MRAAARPVLLLALLSPLPGCGARPLVVGSKKFTESVILGEAATQLLSASGQPARHQAQLGGTRVLWSALGAGEIDLYPEYTGTLCQEVLRTACDEASVRAALAGRGLEASADLGFSDEYALAMPAARAAELGVRTISDLARHPGLRLGFSEELLARADGWPALQRRYRLPHTDVRGLDHDLAWRGLQSGALDVIDAYTTDAEIRYYQPRLLEDDRGFFTRYAALFLYRAGASPRPLPAPAQATLARLAGRISQAEMVAGNARAKVDRVPEAEVARELLQRLLRVESAAPRLSLARRLLARTGEHLLLVSISLLLAVALGVPLGIAAAHRPRLGQLILGATGVLQTVPSLALLVFMIPLFGIGALPALVALWAYSLLPVVRNTASGLDGIAAPLRESAAVIGLSSWEQLRLVELPLALPSILAGVKTAAVIDVGTATLGALIGAGGYGQPILTGIRLDDTALILEGAIPSALLALVVQALFEALESRAVSRGLRGQPPPERSAAGPPRAVRPTPASP